MAFRKDSVDTGRKKVVAVDRRTAEVAVWHTIVAADR